MTFHIITLFPEAFESYFGSSIIKRAVADKKIAVKFYNPRDFVKDKNHRVDQKPYGGGPGMVIEAEPVIRAIEKAKGRKKNIKIIFFSPSGKQFDNKMAKNLAESANEKMGIKDLILVCGRYEGIDSRVQKIFKTENISVGPFIVTGGEIPAMILVDSVSRWIKGVLGNELSPEEMRISSKEIYTRPESFKYKGKKYSVPAVLLSGNHAEIDKWRSQNPSVDNQLT